MGKTLLVEACQYPAEEKKLASNFPLEMVEVLSQCDWDENEC